MYIVHFHKKEQIHKIAKKILCNQITFLVIFSLICEEGCQGAEQRYVVRFSSKQYEQYTFYITDPRHNKPRTQITLHKT